jgi:hypothetical protein
MPLLVDHAAPFSGCVFGGVEGSGGLVGGPGLTAGVSSLDEKRLASAGCVDQGGGHLSRLRPNICVVTLERADCSPISDIACSMCTCADERWAIRSWLHYLRAESTVQQAVGRRAATTRDADDRASGDSLILESGGQLESCPTLIENTERYWTICR